ncbi:Dyp-type peroxidase [Jatrophihabitans sp. YIM 134969]
MGDDAAEESREAPRGPSRRVFLGRAGLVGGGVVAGAAGGVGVGHAVWPGGSDTSADDAVAGAVAPVAFPGEHQAGITDRPPAALRFTALDLRPTASASEARTALQRALQAVGGLGAAVARGDWPAALDETANGLRPSHLTTTVAVGASGLTAAGMPVPAALAPLPSFNNDQLDPARSGGDLAVQVCAEDPHLAAVVTRALVDACAEFAVPRWQQVGFLPGATTTVDVTAVRRNLMGQIDGTGNPTGGDRDAAVWVTADDAGDAPWMAGGSYLVCRRIRMSLDTWSRLSTSAQEQVIGRQKGSGAPLGLTRETDPMDFSRTGPDGRPLVAANAHVRLTHPDNNGGITMLRRSYAYDEGFRSDGTAEAGLFFQAFQTDPRRVFVPVQLKLAALDALTPFVRHVGSAVFAVLPGAADGGYPGQVLFEG